MNLPPGRYELLCNIAGHYGAGMYAELDAIGKTADGLAAGQPRMGRDSTVQVAVGDQSRRRPQTRPSDEGGSMIEVLPDMPEGVTGIRVSGRLRGDDLREFTPAGAHDGCRRGDLHTTVWLSCSTRFPLTIKPPTAWRCAGRSGMDTVISVPGDVERTSNCPPDASTLARIDAIPI